MMIIFLAILANIAVLAGPYIFILIILCNYAKEYKVTPITLCKYDEVKSLFGITLFMQFIFLALVAIDLLDIIFIDHKPISTLADILFTAAELMVTLEFIFGVIFIDTDGVDTSIRFDKELQKQSSKQSIKF